MKIPAGMTEQQVVEVCSKVISIVAPTFVFGYYDYEDICQWCWITIIEYALPKYDGIRPLSNFIYSHLKNRLINLWRDELRRTDPPCKSCHKAHTDTLSPAHVSGEFCAKYKNWLKRNTNKKELARPVALDKVIFDYEASQKASTFNESEFNELSSIIDEKLSANLRTTYKRMLAGEKVVPRKRDAVIEEVKLICESYYGEAWPLIKS